MLTHKQQQLTCLEEKYVFDKITLSSVFEAKHNLRKRLKRSLLTGKQGSRKSFNDSRISMTLENETITIILEKDLNEFEDIITFGESYSNYSKLYVFYEDKDTCKYYSCKVAEDINGKASLTICDKGKSITGLIIYKSRIYEVEQIPENVLKEYKVVKDNFHIVRRYNRVKRDFSDRPLTQFDPAFKQDTKHIYKHRFKLKGSICPSTIKPASFDSRFIKPLLEYSALKRTNIELGVFLAPNCCSTIKNRSPMVIKKYISSLMSVIKTIYREKSIGDPITITLKHIENIKETPDGYDFSGDVSQKLNTFAEFQTEKSFHLKESWDVSVLLSGDNFYFYDDMSKENITDIVACTKANAAVISETDGFKTAYIISHELAHTLGVVHDGAEGAFDCNPYDFIMSHDLDGVYTHVWSPCSQRMLRQNIRYLFNCLYDKKGISIFRQHTMDKYLPGQIYTADTQCKYSFGSKAYAHTSYRPMNMCELLVCKIKGQFSKALAPALEGTLCGPRKWCRRKKCVDIPTVKNEEVEKKEEIYVDKKFDGVWGIWKAVGFCRTNCIKASLGLQKVKRKCIPNPKSPSNSYCKGERIADAGCFPDPLACQDNEISIKTYANIVCYHASKGFTSGYQPQYNPYDISSSCIVHCKQDNDEVISYTPFPDGTLCKNSTHKSKRHYCYNTSCLPFTIA